MVSKKFQSTAKLLLKTGVTVLLVWLVFQKIDLKQVRQVFVSSNPGYLFAGLILYFLSQVVSSWRLLGFLQIIQLPVAFAFNFRLYLLGMFYNVFLPGGIGGDGYKVYLLRKKFAVATKTVLFALLLDRGTGLWAIVVLAAIAVFGLPVLGVPGWWPAIILITAFAGLWLVYRIFFRRFLPYFTSAIVRGLLVQLMQTGVVLLILKALGVHSSFLAYLFSFLLSTIATVIPLSVGGLGLREYAIVQLAPLLLLDKTTAVATSLGFYLISTIAALPGIWFVYASKEFAPAKDAEAGLTENDQHPKLRER